MATSGSFYSSFGTNNAYRLVVEWKRNSTNIANNTSNVTITAYMQSTGSSYTINSSVTKNGTANIAGSVFNFTFSAALSGNQKKQIYTKTMDIYHNADGTRSFSISVSGTIGITFSSGYVSTVSTSGTATLDTIPRGSSFTLSTTSATLGSTSVTVNITRASSSFTHKVYYTFGSNTTTVSSNATTSVSFTPNISLASIIPNATSGTATVYVQTLNGSTVISTTSKTMTFTVPSSVKPSLTSLSATVVAAGAATSYGYVQGLSKCQLTINGATGSYSSTIKSYKITGNGGTWTTSSTTTGVLNTSGTITFTATVTDSRGRTSDAKTVSITVQAYSAPKITNYNVIRCNSSGTATDNGAYLKVYAQYTYSSSISGNSATAKVEYSLNGSTWTSGGTVSSGNSIIVGGSLSANYSYQVRLTVSDKFKSTISIKNLSPAFVTMSVLAGGKGLAFGKMATRELYMDVYINQYLDGNKNYMKYGYMVHDCRGNNGSGGFVKFATITLTEVYVNSAIDFYISRRGGNLSGIVSLLFNNSSTIEGYAVGTFLSQGNIDCYIKSVGSGVFDLYIYKSENYDYITINDVKMSNYVRDRINIVWTDIHASSLPSGCIQANHTVAYTTGGAYFGSNLISFDGTIGTSDTPWGYVYTEGVVNASDEKLKENIKQINKSKNSKLINETKYEVVNEATSETEYEDITMEEMREFIRDEYNMYSYNFKNHSHKEYGFIAQNIADSKVGNKMLIETQNGYLYSQGSYISIIAGALKSEIEMRDEEIKEQKQINEELNNKVNELEKRLVKLEKLLNNE